MSNGNGELITFGKHKGQPIEALAADKQYADWLVQQPWFRERHPKIYNVVINNFCEPSNTPDHNAIQARFLDEDFRLKFVSIAIPRLWWFCEPVGEMVSIVTQWAVENSKHGANPRSVNGCRDDQFAWSLLKISQPVFEKGGIDVAISVEAGINCWIRGSVINANAKSPQSSLEEILAVEIKPSIGDDYPQVLRQMRRNGSKFLLTQNYHGEGVDEPTFIRFMESQGLKIIFEHEIDAAEKFSCEIFDEEKFLSDIAEKISAAKK